MASPPDWSQYLKKMMKTICALIQVDLWHVWGGGCCLLVGTIRKQTQVSPLCVRSMTSTSSALMFHRYESVKIWCSDELK